MPTGTLTTDGTEQDIFSGEPDAATGEVEGSLDLSNMTSSEELTVRLYKAVDGTNDRVVQAESYAGAQDEPAVVIGPLAGDPDDAPIRLSVELTAGSNIDIPWEYQRVY